MATTVLRRMSRNFSGASFFAFAPGQAELFAGVGLPAADANGNGNGGRSRSGSFASGRVGCGFWYRVDRVLSHADCLRRPVLGTSRTVFLSGKYSDVACRWQLRSDSGGGKLRYIVVGTFSPQFFFRGVLSSVVRRCRRCVFRPVGSEVACADSVVLGAPGVFRKSRRNIL